jgi:hypothetical protein
LVRTRELTRTVFLLGFSVAACRYGYELIPLEEDLGVGSAAGDTSRAGGDSGGSTANGGTGGTDAPLDGGSDGDGGAEGIAGSGVGAVGGNGGISGSGGSAGSGVPPDSALCNQITNAGHDYLLCQERRTWADANSGCLAIGMQLIRVDDDAENQWLFFNANVPLGVDGEVWLGATDLEVEGEWRWTDGELFWLGDNLGSAQNGLFNGWYFREPNNASVENCAALDTKAAGAEWYDLECDLSKAYACESL